MVREMIGGCCVCLDERGWNENPLVYCDGSGCTIAVHQACYGIVRVPSGPWFCCKCQSQERVARVKCELCPQKDGALKRTDTGGWAHVVCALYIPEVRFGDVSTMEPIIFSSVPAERFNKSCYICDERNKESGKSHGACMSCHKTGCKLSFHVTCAQSKRQLCEEASINGHVQYVGYCTNHWQKRLKMKYQSNGETDSKKIPKERKNSRIRTESTSSANSVELNPARVRKAKSYSLFESENSQDEMADSTSPIKNIKKDSSDSEKFSETQMTKPLNNDTVLTPVLKDPVIKDSAIKKSKSKSPCNGNVEKDVKSPILSPKLSTKSAVKHRKRLKSFDQSDEDDDEEEKCEKKKHDKKDNEISAQKKPVKAKKQKVEKQEQIKDKVTLKEKKKTVNYVPKKDKAKKKKDKTIICNGKKKKAPEPPQLNLLENNKTDTLKDTPDNFHSFLEYQWNQSAQFITSKAKHYDVASLLGCLHQLKSDNTNLESRLTNLQLRKERLLAINARLAASFPPSNNDVDNTNKPSLSDMLSKLNETCTTSSNPANKIKEENKEIIPKDKKGRKSDESSHSETSTLSCNEQQQLASSSDLAMLAAASIKHDIRSPTAADNKPGNLSSIPGGSMLMQPNVEFASHSHTSSYQSSTNNLLNGILLPDAKKNLKKKT